MLIFSSPHPTSSPRKHLTLNHFLVGMPRSDWTWCTIIRYNDRTNHNDNQNRRDRNAGTFSRCVLSLFCCPCQEASSVVLELALPPTQKALSHSPWRRVNAVSQWLRSHAAMRQARVAKSSVFSSRALSTGQASCQKKWEPFFTLPYPSSYCFCAVWDQATACIAKGAS